MADIKTLSINSNNFNFKDSEARNYIKSILSDKMDAFTPISPLSIKNNELTIDLSEYATKTNLNTEKTSLTDLISEKETNSNNKFNSIFNLLQHTFGSYVEANDDLLLNFNAELPVLKNYNNDIKSLQNQIDTLNTTEQTDKNNLQTSINELSSNTTLHYEEFRRDYEENINTLKARCTKLENEVYGSTTATNENSRLDKMETKLNKIYEALTNIGIIKD